MNENPSTNQQRRQILCALVVLLRKRRDRTLMGTFSGLRRATVDLKI